MCHACDQPTTSRGGCHIVLHGSKLGNILLMESEKGSDTAVQRKGCLSAVKMLSAWECSMSNLRKHLRGSSCNCNQSHTHTHICTHKQTHTILCARSEVQNEWADFNCFFCFFSSLQLWSMSSLNWQHGLNWYQCDISVNDWSHWTFFSHYFWTVFKSQSSIRGCCFWSIPFFWVCYGIWC